MNEYQFVALLLATVGPILAFSRLASLPPSLVLFGAGLGSAFLPGLPPLRVDPQLVLSLFLPPLLYASTVRVSWHLLRFTLMPGVVLGALLVFATVGTVAVAARFVLLPGLSWTAALLLGVVASIFDTRLFHEAKGRPHVPRAVADTLKARELVSRIVVLATFGLVVETATRGEFSPLLAFNHYILDIPAGIAFGFVVGHLMAWARQRIDPAPVEIAVSIATPFIAALGARALGISIVGAVTTAALVISAVRIDRTSGAPISSSETRVSATAFWEEVSLIVSSVLFFLGGRALPEALAAAEAWPLWTLAGTAAAVLAIVVALQVAFAYPATGMAPIAAVLEPRGNRRAAAAFAMAWSSTRSVIGLVIALSIPASLGSGQASAERDLILIVAGLTIVGSVLLQGLTLRAVMKRTSLSDEEEDDREKEIARDTADQACASPGREHANGFDAARQALLRLREEDRIGDEVLVSMLREMDLRSRAAEGAREGSAMPGAGPPNP